MPLTIGGMNMYGVRLTNKEIVGISRHVGVNNKPRTFSLGKTTILQISYKYCTTIISRKKLNMKI